VEEERVKSAFELAMERISSLPELTAEEIAEQKEKQHGPFGEAAAGRYLNGSLSDDELTGEMGKYRGEQLAIVRRAALSSFCRALRLEGDPETSAKALKGVGLIAPDKSSLVQRAAEDFGRLLGDFDRERRERSAEFAPSVLKAFGVGGSAVRVNLPANERWLEELTMIRKAYEPGLEAVRSALMRELGDPPVPG
jgi:hypothetical protein